MIARAALALAGALPAIAAAPAAARSLGETYTCRFPKVGTVVIDTREPGSSITVNGKRYAADSGSDHYVTPDGKIMVMFGPRMSWWSWQDTFVRDRCVRQLNRR